MAKNIVLCSDGTGNQDIKNRGTNVFKLYESVDIQGHKNNSPPKQVAFYDDGVGTGNPIAEVIGGAFGWGFSRNVKKLYRELINVYEPGDSIYLFGFSRGAYTVRAFAGLIQYCGILDADYFSSQPRDVLTEAINTCWKDFRKVAFTSLSTKERRGLVTTGDDTEASTNATIERRKVYHAVNPEEKLNIAFIGVWDTVGAIGTPFDELRKIISFIYPIWFSDNTLGPEVTRACHALSIDDERRTFQPELWNEKNGQDTRIKQVWFAGVHSNVGGGYPKQGMSLVTLDWMMTEARLAGLRFIDTDLRYVHEHQDVHDKLFDSRAGLAIYYRWAPRDIYKLCADHKIPTPTVHISVFERIANGTNAYAPGNIPFACNIDMTGRFDSWPNPNVPHEIQSVINVPSAGHKTSLLDSMLTTVNIGKGSYYAFLLVTLVTLSALAGGVCSGCWSSLVWTALFFAVCGIVIDLLSRYVDCALFSKYAGFWHDCRGPLRKIM